jgi:hypothetical protein
MAEEAPGIIRQTRLRSMKQWMMAQQPELNSLDIRPKCATVPQ